MTGTQFAMVSEWMPNGNVSQFVMAHRDANRFELVSFAFRLLASPPLINDYVVSVVSRRREGLDLYARSGNGPWGYQGGAFSRASATLDL